MNIYREIKGIPEPEETSENKEPDRPGQPQAKPWEQFEPEKRKEQQPVGPEGTAQGQDAGESGRWTPPSLSGEPAPSASHAAPQPVPPSEQYVSAVISTADAPRARSSAPADSTAGGGSHARPSSPPSTPPGGSGSGSGSATPPRRKRE